MDGALPNLPKTGLSVQALNRSSFKTTPKAGKPQITSNAKADGLLNSAVRRKRMSLGFETTSIISRFTGFAYFSEVKGNFFEANVYPKYSGSYLQDNLAGFACAVLRQWRRWW